MKAEFTVRRRDINLRLRIPADIAASVRRAVDPRARVSARGDAITVGPQRRQRHRLAALLRGFTRQNRHDAADFGTPVGKELL